jgi:p-cumate 2,3-dioxygenase beta subunit
VYDQNERSLQASVLTSLERNSLVQPVTEFLYHEARLLDDWLLDDWVALFVDGARYVVPTTDAAAGSPRETLFLIDDDLRRLTARVERLKSRWAHREFPWSRTRRLVTNIELIGRNGEDIYVDANFLIYRIRRTTDVFIGTYRHILREVDGDLRFVYRRATLDLEALDPQATVSVII